MSEFAAAVLDACRAWYPGGRTGPTAMTPGESLSAMSATSLLPLVWTALMAALVASELGERV